MQKMISDADEALANLETSIDKLVSNAMHEEEADAVGLEEVSFALDAMASTLVDIDVLELRSEFDVSLTPSLEDVLAILASSGWLQDEAAANIAEAIIEYINATDYELLPPLIDHHHVSEYRKMIEAIRALLDELEGES